MQLRARQRIPRLEAEIQQLVTAFATLPNFRHFL
jgi:hypothetical protein